MLAVAACESAPYNEILAGKSCTSAGECVAGYSCIEGSCVSNGSTPGDGGFGSDEGGRNGNGGSPPNGAAGQGGADCVTAGDCPPDLLAEGSACEEGPQCVSGSCVDGVCCESACTGSCYACSALKNGAADGGCLAIADGADPDGECGASYISCNGAGACVCDDCDRPLGAACVDGPQCTSGNCADGICCNAACEGTCLSCRGDDTGATDGTCADIEPGTDPDNECNGNKTCNGNGQCCNSNGQGCEG
jgi:hypothetical protein